MSEETAPVEGGAPQEAAPTADPFAEKAKAAGWKPLEEFDGDPEAWVDAKEFVKRAPLYEKNHKLKRELAELKNALHEVKGHISKVSESAYKKAIADLEARRDEAIDLGDKEQVREIDKAIREAEAIKAPVEAVHPAIADWEKKNGEWFYADKEISAFGMARAQAYLAQHPNDFEGAMEVMEKDIKRAFPEKFEKTNPKRKEPPPVETGGNSPAGRTFGESDLTDEQRKVMKTFVRQGIMTKEDYIKELATSGLIGGRK